MSSSTPSFGDLPRATHTGRLKLGATEFDCYVLSDERRVLSKRQFTRAITGKDAGNLVHYLARSGVRSFVSGQIDAVHFRVGERSSLAHGLTAETVVGILSAYSRALAVGALRTARQIQIAAQCAVLLGACAGIGLTALIDEATGYQQLRTADALQVKLAAYLADEMRPWSKCFPDAFWAELARLARWKGKSSSRPKWFGLVVRDVVYDALDPDVCQHILTTRPPSTSSARWHQWFTHDFGAKRLVAHLEQVTAIARTCSAMREFRERVHLAFRSGPGQRPLPLQ